MEQITTSGPVPASTAPAIAEAMRGPPSDPSIGPMVWTAVAPCAPSTPATAAASPDMITSTVSANWLALVTSSNVEAVAPASVASPNTQIFEIPITNS